MTAIWKTLGKKLIHKTRWIEVWEDDVVMPDGEKGVYTYIKREDGICVILIDGDYVYMTEQERYATHERCLQFILETAEEAEPIEDTARRGVREEAGFEVDEITVVGKGFTDAGLNTQVLHFAIARGITQKVGRKIEATEQDMVIKKVKIADLDKLVENGTIKDMHTFAGLYWLKRYMKQ